MLGLILGGTQFPKEILKKIKKLKIKHFIIDLSQKKEFKKEKNVNYVSFDFCKFSYNFISYLRFM